MWYTYYYTVIIWWISVVDECGHYIRRFILINYDPYNTFVIVINACTTEYIVKYVFILFFMFCFIVLCFYCTSILIIELQNNYNGKS